MAPIIDVSVNLRGHTKLPFYQKGPYSEARSRGETTWTQDALVAALDDAGIEKAGVIASVAALGVGGEIDAIHVDEVQEVIESVPERLFGWVGINPLTTMETLRYIEYAVGELGFKGVHIYPHWFGVRIDDRKYWPIYAKCAELDVPLAIQVGRQTPRNHAKLVAKPSWLDPVAFDFPELKLLGLHIGMPWTDEMIAMCQAWENVYILADAHEPKYWDDSLVEYLSGKGRRNEDGIQKVIWGTDWPIQEFKKSLEDVDRLGLDQDAKDNLLGLNALRVFDI
jgi:uncharacterized protein